MSEAILDPGRKIIDTHHHLWDRRGEAHKQNPPSHPFDEVTRRMSLYMLDAFMADIESGHDIRATVYMECRTGYRTEGPPEMAPVGETEFISGMTEGIGDVSSGRRPCAAIVGRADLTLGARISAVLEAHIAAGRGRFRGVRHSAPYDPDPSVMGSMVSRPPGVYLDPKFREGLRCVEALGLSFDAWLLEPQLPDLIDLAHTMPGTAICLDHTGTPLGLGSYAGTRRERFGIWRANIKKLAECPNVHIKLGGLAMPLPGFPQFMADPPATSVELAEEWRPYVETCIEAFSPARAMFESNFPVDALSCSYATLWNAFKRLAAGYSENEKHDLFFGTAARFYRPEV